MAKIITATNLTADQSTAIQSSFTTASISPGANKLVLVAVDTYLDTGLPNSPTVSGCNMTWVSVGTITISSTLRLTLLRGLSASPTSGALTIDFAGQNQKSVQWAVDQFTNIDTSGTNGSGAIVQTANNSGTGLSGITVTLAAFANVNNATYGTAMAANTSSPYISPGANFTQLGQGSASNNSVESEWASTNQTSVNWTRQGTDIMMGIAVEIKAKKIFQGGMI